MDENQDLAKQYQEILKQYSQKLSPPSPPPVPEPELMLTPQIQTPPLSVTPPPKSTGNFFKYLFFISLLIFLGVCSAIIYTVISTGSNSQPKPTPSPVAIPTVISKVCQLNDQSYLVGQSFNAADGCNTCACTPDLTIVCTQKACDLTPTASSAKLTLSTIKPLSGIIDSQITLTGTGFASTGNIVVFSSTDIVNNNCSYFYNDLTSIDGKNITFKLVSPPSEVRCYGVEGTDSVNPTEILSGNYDVSVNVGDQGSYTKVKLVTFSVL